ncbi:MAG: porin [Neisseria sp.]|nr:porin [Neisseria sp.]
MKKTLIALSLATLSGAALADVTLYGQIKAGVEVSNVKVKAAKNGESAELKSKTATEIADFGSRIGFKGHESLGNGVNAVWKLEQSASVAGNSAGWATREGYIGVETQAGTVRAGKIGTQFDNMGQVDAWESANPVLGLGIFTRTGSKELSVRYDSPVVAGLSGNVQFTPRDNANADDKYTRKDKTNAAYYAGLNYERSGFFAQYGFGLKKNNADDFAGKAVSGSAHRLEAGYDAGNLLVAAGYQQTKAWDNVADYADALSGGNLDRAAQLYGYDDFDDLAAADAEVAAVAGKGLKTREVALTAAYRLGNVTPKLSYAHGWDVKFAGGDKVKGTKYDQVLVGADYDLSKRTTAFAQAGWLRSGGKLADGAKLTVENKAGLVGLRHKF